MTESEIRVAVAQGEIGVTFLFDYKRTHRINRNPFKLMEFCERAWRKLLLAATNRSKSSRKLNDTQKHLNAKPSLSERGLHVQVLTVEAALRLQDAGYDLERYERCSEPKASFSE